MTLDKRQIQWLKAEIDYADCQPDEDKSKVNKEDKYIITQDELCINALNKIHKTTKWWSSKKILVVDTIEFIPILLTFGARECNITYIAPYVHKGATAKTIGVSVVNNSLLTWKTNMKFDVIVANPPYLKDTHLKFLSKAAELCTEQLIFIHPAAWLTKQSEVSKIEGECIELVEKYDTNFTFIKGAYYFGVTQYTPCSITHINFRKLRVKSDPIKIYDETKDRTYLFSSVKNINVISDSTEYIQLIKKMEEFTDNNIGMIFGRSGNFYVTLPKIRGSCGGKKSKQKLFANDFYTLIPKNCVPTTTKPIDAQYIGFDTYDESVNFIEYLKSDLARFGLALLKFDANIQKSKLKYIPCLDFKKPFTNDNMSELFNKQHSWIEIVQSIIPKYYD
jgi:hypothetical protein